jgi:phosphatidylinositol alpha-1,6-mannosyltransferase
MTERRNRRRDALLVTRNFPPLVGGMERVNLGLCESLAGFGRVALVGPKGCAQYAPAGTRVSQVALRPLAWFVLASAAGALATALRRPPAVVLAGSGLTAPMAWLAARLTGARAAVYVHGLDLVAPSRLYAMAWLPFIRRCDRVICNSSNTRFLALGRGVPEAALAVVNPGVEMPAAEDSPMLAEAFRREQQLGDRPVLLSVGRFTRRKGLAEFVAGALPAIVAAVPSALLVVVGDEAVDALHGGQRNERARITAAAEAAGVAANLRFVGRLGESALLGAYAAAACHCFPVLAIPGDVEGFGMVALESAAHGLPTVAFNVGGVADAVQVPQSGTLVPPGDYPAFAAAVVELLCRPPEPAIRDAARRFARGKEWRVFREGVLRALADPNE